MNGHTYRTLKQAEALRDYSNQTLRFNRTRKDAGMEGDIDDASPFGFFGMLICAALVGLATWAGLILLFSWSTQ